MTQGIAQDYHSKVKETNSSSASSSSSLSGHRLVKHGIVFLVDGPFHGRSLEISRHSIKGLPLQIIFPAAFDDQISYDIHVFYQSWMNHYSCAVPHLRYVRVDRPLPIGDPFSYYGWDQSPLKQLGSKMNRLLNSADFVGVHMPLVIEILECVGSEDDRCAVLKT